MASGLGGPGQEGIVISDDDTASGGDIAATPPQPSAKALGKRRAVADEEVKVEWTDDDDEDPRSKFTKRRAVKKRTGGTAKKQGAGPVKKKRRKTIADWDSGINDVDESLPADAFEDADVPQYIRQRRREFDETRERLKEAGLRLPPDYAEVDFSDDGLVHRLAVRPKFDDSSGIKPCRPCQDVELEYSAGIIPASIAQYLRDYQIVGVKFLHQLFVYQRGGILGDDMGLGKTVQVAAFLTAAFGKTGDERDVKRMRKMRRAGDVWYPRVLIICPGSLIENWKNELNRWGWWVVDLYHGPGKEDVLHAARAGMVEIMVTTYVTYKTNRNQVNAIKWDAVVADECHLFKERRSEVTIAMNEVNSLCRIGLTGTAIQNKYEELWTLLHWTNPGQVGTVQEWIQTISKPLGKGQSHDATLHELSIARKTAKKLVQNLLPQFFLRRMKSLIADQLPKKSDKVVFCPLTEVQREAYENFLNSERVDFVKKASEPCPCGSGGKRGWCCYAILPNGKVWQAAVFPIMQTLQKLSNHLTLLIPSNRDPGDKQESELDTLRSCLPNDWEDLYRNRDSMLNLANPRFCGKWVVLKKLLRFWHENGDKVLIFSHSVRLLHILQHLFNNTSYTVSYLDGSLSYEDRQRAVDDFNCDPTQFVFLISTKAGGVGLNITSANKVVIFDPHWNPSYDLQAQDRAYRIGQTRDVDVFRLISVGTIEEVVYARQIYKQQQANIGYNASSERRYFRGVQQDSLRKGEIFGLANLLAFHGDQIMLRDIVNKTNIAEAKVGVQLGDIDMERMVKEEGDDLAFIKKEEDIDDGGDSALNALATLVVSESQEAFIKQQKAARKPGSDAIQAILASAGVEYTHENSEVIGSSKVEAQLSRRAELAADSATRSGGSGGGGGGGDAQSDPLFTERMANSLLTESGEERIHYRFNPPEDVMRRQFCSMAREFGFPNATAFALVVESWTQEQRRNCLDTFYKRRAVGLAETDIEDEGAKSDEDGKDLDLMAIKAEPEVEIGRDGPSGGHLERAISPPLPSVIKVEEPEDEKKVSSIFLYGEDDDEDDEL